MLEDFALLVKNDKYTKIKYSDWRTLKSWSQRDDKDYFIRIVYHAAFHDFSVRPYTYNSENEVQEHLDFPQDDKSFGEYLFDNWDHISTVLNSKLTYAISTAANAIADSAKAATASFKDLEQALNSNYFIYEDSAYIQDRDSAWQNLDVATVSLAVTPYKVEINSDSILLDGTSLTDKIEEIVKNIQNLNKTEEKENSTMKFNFDFGPVDASVRMSMYGMAIKNASGSYVAYDTNSDKIMDVDIFNFDGASKFIYKMPSALRDVRAGDVIIHARKPMFVQMVGKDGRLKVLDIYDGEEKTVVPATSPFGFNFVTKVISLINLNGAASAENPFGGMLPLLMMSGDTKTDDMLPMILMMNGGMDMSNPMMMWALMGNRTNDPMMLAMAMVVFNNKNTCDCKCGSCSCENSDK